MGNSSRDQNRVSTLIATLDSNGSTVIAVKAVPSSHALKVSDGTTGSDNGPADAPRDESYVTTLLAVSEVDGVTPVVAYADVNGNLLIDSN